MLQDISTGASAYSAHPEASAPVQDKAVPLRDFLRQTGDLLRANWPRCLWVEATVLAVKPNAQGHTLELVDAGPGQAASGQLRAFLSSSRLAGLRRDIGMSFKPEHLSGMTTVLQIAPNFHAKWHLQAEVVGIAKSVQQGIAARVTAEALEKLRAEGLLDRQKKLGVPADITRLVVIHPAGAAGYTDISAELHRWHHAGILEFTSVSAPFEGDRAVAALIAALHQAARPRQGQTLPDMILLVRGGGGRAGLSQMDDEMLARAVATLPVRVIAGLGHAIDRSLVDEVAWKTVDTPSKALALVGGIVRDAASRALGNTTAIQRAADIVITRTNSDLSALWLRTCSGGERRTGEIATGLVTLWLRAKSYIATTSVQLKRTRDDLDQCHQAIAASVQPALRRADEVASRQFADIIASSRICISRADPGDALVGVVKARAAAVAGQQAQAVDHSIASIASLSRNIMQQQDGNLQLADTLIEAADPKTILQRGFVLVAGPDGKILTTSAAAQKVGSLVLTFGDGALAATTVSSPQQAEKTQ